MPVIIHHLCMMLAGIIRFVRKWVIRIAVFGFLIALNVATVVSDKVYDFLNHVVWQVEDVIAGEVGDRKTKTRTEMNDDMERSRKEADLAKARADQAEAEADRSRAELDEAKQRNRTLSSDLDAKNEQITKTTKDLDISREDLRVAKLDVEKAQAEIGRTRVELDQVKTRNRALSVDLDIKDRRIAQMAGDIDLSRKSEEKALDTLAGLRGRLVRAVRRGVASDSLEAVPFVGTAVFLGSLAYETNDACKQLQELQALEAALLGKDVEPVSEAICLKSFEDIVAVITGKDRGYAKCVSDRASTGNLEPPSCAGYPPAIPKIEEGASRGTEGPAAPKIE